MASDASFVQFVVDQVNGAGTITTRFMFGDYALYCNEKVVALICDNKFFVKPTDAGRAYIGTPMEAPAYTGAKLSFLIEEKLEDRGWLTELIRITEKQVAAPKAKKTPKATPKTARPKAKPKTARPKAKPKTARPKAKPKTKPKTKAKPKTAKKRSSPKKKSTR